MEEFLQEFLEKLLENFGRFSEKNLDGIPVGRLFLKNFIEKSLNTFFERVYGKTCGGNH